MTNKSQKDIAIAIIVGSPNSTINLVKKTLDSIRKNIGTKNYTVFINLGEKIPSNLKKFVKDYVEQYKINFTILLEKEVYWAEFINLAIDNSKQYKYFIKSHDDIELLTNDFFNLIETFYHSHKRNLGWISFTDIGWKNGDFSPSVRPGYFKDILNTDKWKDGRIFQFHKFPKFWFRSNFILDFAFHVIYKFNINFIPYPKPKRKIKKYLLDLPKKPVIAHAPFNHFVLIKRTSLDLIGHCENWATYNALYVDEDWGLSCLKNNMPNIWIPHIEYFHYRGTKRRGETRSIKNINKNNERVKNNFKKKWGFNPNPSNEELDFIKSTYSNTLIPWSISRNSYEWDYNI